MRAYRPLTASLAALAVTACGDSGPTETPEDPELVCNVATTDLFLAAAPGTIPALVKPDLGPVGAVPFQLEANHRALGVVVNGAARAYPFPVLVWHEVVNDTLGGESILLTYCPLTGSGIVFDPHVQGQTREFDVSGLLYRSNLTLIDLETETLWNQMLMGSQCGVDRGMSLTRIPVIETTIGRWLEMYPEATVMTTSTGHARDYTDNPYSEYWDLNNELVNFLPVGVTWNPIRQPKELTLGVFDGFPEQGDCRAASGCISRAYPFGMLAEDGQSVVRNDTVGTRQVLITFQADRQQAIAFDRVVDGQVLTFELATIVPLRFTDQQTGSAWDERGVATAGPLAGTQLAQIADSYVAFWFAWSIYFRNIQLYRGVG